MTTCPPDRCKATRRITGLHAIIRSFDDQPLTVRCRLEPGHDGKHKARFQPFPGFADEHIAWSVCPECPQCDDPARCGHHWQCGCDFDRAPAAEKAARVAQLRERLYADQPRGRHDVPPVPAPGDL